MNKIVINGALVLLPSFCFSTNATALDNSISQQEAIKAALSAVDVEVLGIRQDTPDNQWDVFIKKGEMAFEVEVNATTGEIVAVEQESLAEIQAELSGDLSHEGAEGDVDKQ